MKKLFPLLLTAVAFTITACHSTIPENCNETENSTTVETSTAASTTKETTKTTEPETSAEPLSIPSEWDLSAFEIFGYYIADTNSPGQIVIRNDFESGEKCDFDTYRKYFFGTWESELEGVSVRIIDDSEKENLWGWSDGFYKIGDNIIVSVRASFAGATIIWIDTNNPNILYYNGFGYGPDDGYYTVYNINRIDSYPKVTFLTKTDAPINQPENGYLSSLRLRELADEHEIEWEMLTHIDDFDEYYLWRSEWEEKYPIYLISESHDKLVLKSQLGQWLYGEEKVDIIYTIEKVNGEWVRTVEIDQEQLERVRERS